MNNFDETINNFKYGNEQRRLELSLFKRNLRSEFSRIENDESESIKTEIRPDSEQITIKNGNTKKHRSLLIKFSRWCFSLLS